MRKIVKNYENLPETEKSRVTDASYQLIQTVCTPPQEASASMGFPRRTPVGKLQSIRGSRYGDPRFARALQQLEAHNVSMDEPNIIRSQEQEALSDPSQQYDSEAQTQGNKREEDLTTVHMDISSHLVPIF